MQPSYWDLAFRQISFLEPRAGHLTPLKPFTHDAQR